jgi:hypothetical protein
MEASRTCAQAVGLAEAAFTSWHGSNLDTSDRNDLYRELEARLADLASYGMRGLLVEDRLVIAPVASSTGPYSSSVLVFGRGTGDEVESSPVELSELTILFTTETVCKDCCCAVRRLYSHNDFHIMCGACCDGDSIFCKVHLNFRRTNPARIILPEEWNGMRFAVGHEKFGLRYFLPMSDAHVAQHFSELGMVPSEVMHMARTTTENVGSPQNLRVLRDLESRGGDAQLGLTTPGVNRLVSRMVDVKTLVVAYEEALAAKAATSRGLEP